MELEGITLSEISLRQILYDLTYMWNLKKKLKTFIEIGWWFPGVRAGWVKLVKVYKLPVTR